MGNHIEEGTTTLADWGYPDHWASFMHGVRTGVLASGIALILEALSRIAG